jgi:hypothetical protein
MHLHVSPAARRLATAAALTLSVALAVAACSSGGTASASAPVVGSSTGSGSGVGSAAPSPSLTNGQHIDAVVAGLTQALALYKSGSVQPAIDLVAETYEDHFELIEQPLASADESFMEDLESLIATKIRQAMSANSPAADVAALVTEAEGKLATAKTMLK